MENPKMSFRCDECETDYPTQKSLRRHTKSRRHQRNVEKSELDITQFDKLTEFKFVLKNIKGEVIGETIVDKLVYEHIIINGYSVGPGAGKYVCMCIKQKKYALHRYIYYDIYKNEQINGNVIDHINNDRLDNRIENLREVTCSQNSVNKIKKPNTTSKYYGVSRATTKGTGGSMMWQCQFRSNDFQYNFIYENELHAAHHYDLLVKQ